MYSIIFVKKQKLKWNENFYDKALYICKICTKYLNLINTHQCMHSKIERKIEIFHEHKNNSENAK